MSVGDRIFQNDYSLSSSLSSGEAALVYLRYFLLPFMAKYSEEDCVRILEEPPADVLQMSKDFVMQMANNESRLAAERVSQEAEAEASAEPQAAKGLVEKVHKHCSGASHIIIQELERTTFLQGSMRPGK